MLFLFMLGYFWCSVVPSVTLSRNLRKFEKRKKTKIKNLKKRKEKKVRNIEKKLK